MSTIAQATNKAHRRFGFLWAMVDFLTALNAFLLLINLLIFVSIINQPKVVNEGVQLNAQYIAIMSWPSELDCDVDIWVRNPNGNMISFKAKDADHMTLDRDDRGVSTDTTIMPDGSVVVVTDNREYVTFRQMFEGEYTINVHLYGCKFDNLAIEPYSPVPEFNVNVELISLNPVMTTVYKKDLTFSEVWQEQTALNFAIDSRGKYRYISDTFEQFVVVN